jgi:hypothetical protein
MSDAVKRVSAEISESEIPRSRDFQADSALASGRASGNQLGRPRFARKGARPSDSRPPGAVARRARGEKGGVRDVAVWSRFDFPGGGIRVCRSATKSGGLGDSATSERTRSERGVLLTALP